MGQYLPVLALLVLAALFAAVSFVASGLLNKARPTSAKVAPYECGIVPSREPPDRFPSPTPTASERRSPPLAWMPARASRWSSSPTTRSKSHPTDHEVGRQLGVRLAGKARRLDSPAPTTRGDRGADDGCLGDRRRTGRDRLGDHGGLGNRCANDSDSPDTSWS